MRLQVRGIERHCSVYHAGPTRKSGVHDVFIVVQSDTPPESVLNAVVKMVVALPLQHGIGIAGSTRVVM